MKTNNTRHLDQIPLLLMEDDSIRIWNCEYIYN